MKKRILALILICTTVFALAACGSNEQTSESSIVGNTDVSEESETKTSNDDQKVTFEEMVVVDNDECMVKITDINKNGLWGYTLKASLENKSSEKTYMFAIESAAVDGVQCDPLFASEISPGKKANEDISFSNSALEENGINDFSEIELTFRVYNSENWEEDAIVKETVYIYPYGEDQVKLFEREVKDTDNVVIDNDYVTVIVTGYEEDSIWGYTANLFIVNKSDANIMVSADDVSVNGYMADPFFATSVLPGKCEFSSMSWSDGTLEENGITNIEEIEITFRVFDNDDWMKDDYAKETVTLQP